MYMACVIYFKGNWDDHLHHIEFAKRNSYHSSIQMNPYETLYGWRYRSYIRWLEVSSRVDGVTFRTLRYGYG